MIQSNQNLISEMNQINWHHAIHIPGIGVTPGRAGIGSNMVEALGSFPNVQGKSVLDIGAWDGYYSFLAEQKNASRVLATDSYVWSGQTGSHSNAGFEFARTHLNSRVESQLIDIMDINDGLVGKFDIILFLGVIYHLQDPLRALRNLRTIANQTLVLETIVWRPFVSRSMARYYESDTLNDDNTNFFVPTVECLHGWLKDTGFSPVQTFLGPNRSLIGARIKSLLPFELLGVPLCRCVVHANPI